MKYTILAVAVLLTGCAFDKEVLVKEVKVPVPVKCQTPDPAQPAYRFQPPYDNVFDSSRDLIGDRELALAYENELRTALKSCK